MRSWVKRAGYLVIILLWLVLISLPVAAFLLATQEVIQIGDERGGVRLFLLQDTDSQGIGLQWTRKYEAADLDSADCTRTSLRYFLWEGGEAGQNVEYCSCVDSQSQASLPTDTCELP